MRLPRNAIFDSTGLAVELERRSIRGGASTLTAQVVVFGVQMLGTIVLARILTPSDYGLIGMALTVVNFAATFKTFGLSAATQQAKAVTPGEMAALYRVNVVVSLALAAATAAAAPLVARFYHESRLTAITVALALTFVISGVAVQHDALLRRHMRFTALAILQVLAQVLGTATSITLALIGVRYWSLVGGTLVSATATTLFTLYLCPWRPRRDAARRSVRRMVTFGLNVTGFEFVNYFSRNLDNILIGRYIGAAPLGIYSKAYQLFMLPITQVRAPIQQVALPALSALRGDPPRYLRYYTRLTDILAAVVVPLTTFVFVEADFLVRLLLGPQWMAAVPVFRILAIAGIVQGVASTRGLVQLSYGYSGRYLRWGIANALAMIIAFFAGLPYGIEGVAAAYVIANYIILVPSLWYCFRDTPLTIGGFMRTLVMPLVISALAAAAAVLVRLLADGGDAAVNVAACALFVAVYAALSALRPMVRDTVARIRAGMPAVSPGQGE